MDLPALAAALLGPDGGLAARLPHFRHRPEQAAMAAEVATVIADGGTLICEAGTGTGKTFAYLVPALSCECRVLISTGTRNLQDQLFHRDIPVIREALGRPVQVALLKGRGNYLCRYRLDAAVSAPQRFAPRVRAQLARVRDWSSVTRAGDIAELALPEDAPVWPAVTSTTDNCLGQGCPSFAGCHLVAARRRAQEAEIVVINHHLLCADMALREEGFGEVLPGADCVIVDEAHQLPEVATLFFGCSLSARQLVDLARDVQVEAAREAADSPGLRPLADALRTATLVLREALGSADRRGPWAQLQADAATLAALADLQARITALGEGLAALAGRGKGLDHCLARARALAAQLATLLVEEQVDASDDARKVAPRVRWFDVQGRGFRLHQTPLEVAGVFRGYRERQPAAWVFTSATLAVADSFEHFAGQLGLEEARTACWQSAFDYRRQALCYLPVGLPEPAAPDYIEQVLTVACAVLELSRGRAFLLFTSHRALRLAAVRLRGQIDYPLLVQGEAPRSELIERFRRFGNAVLLGTSSFWEGVDVRGEALSCVIIDKLPFASPGDPVLQARLDALRRGGGNPFRDYQLPQAVIALKQGAGRLIRDAADRGVLVLCDPRLLQRGYGRIFMDSLPAMTCTQDLAEVAGFFAAADG
ncbi:MAG: ATP-dependent DNA helicase [Chromatiaceae bacterium]|nr:MAG: ATP-dependent DNA helicase [Chromatiaceae bacterium]